MEGEDKVEGDGDDRRGAVEMEHDNLQHNMVDTGRKWSEAEKPKTKS